MARKRQEMTAEERKELYLKNSEYQKKRRAALTADQRREIRRAVYDKYKSDKYRKTAADYMRMRRRQNPAAAMAERLRARVKHALRRGGASKFQGTSLLTGCDGEALRDWIQNQFQDGMTWDNRSEWHIDHIIPCAAFNMNDESQQQVAFHFSNLRPMWATENIIKKETVPVPGGRLFWSLSDIAEARRILGLIQPPGWRLDRLGRLSSITPMAVSLPCTFRNRKDDHARTHAR